MRESVSKALYRVDVLATSCPTVRRPSAQGRFDPFATPSPNDRYLRGTAAHDV